MHSACVFEAHAECFFVSVKPPVGGLDSLLGAACGTPCGGRGAFAWLHADKHIETLNFYVNFRVLGGF